MRPAAPSLITSAAIDAAPLISLQNLIFGPFGPEDLEPAEMVLRALITVETLHPVQFVESEAWHGLHPDVLDDEPPIGDSVLDYEFRWEPTSIPRLPTLYRDEEEGIERLVTRIITASYNKPLDQLTTGEIVSGIPVKWCVGIDEDDVSAEGQMFAMQQVLRYVRTLIRYHRAGSLVFSSGLVYQACEEHLFSKYPAGIFTTLDHDWQEFVRKVTGPGIGLTVPPILALVLTRAKSRERLSLAIRELREEYAASRGHLWEYLRAMWQAPTLREQLRHLAALEAAGEHLFRAAFPQRLRLLQTGLSIATKLGDMKPLSALEEAGKAALNIDEAWSRVSAIGFTKQLAYDLRRIDGMDTLLRRILTRNEANEFGIT